MNLVDHTTVERLVIYLQSDDCLLLKNKGKCWRSVIALRQSTNEVGLSHQQIFSIAQLAATQKLGEFACRQLIYSLIPREKVSEQTVLMILSKICADLQSLKIKELLIRWLILVLDLMSSKRKLYCLYGVLFHYIESDTLSPHICHLLFLLTRKRDVTHYRIARLLDLQRRVGSQPHLCGLLSIYRMYRPSLISMSGGYRTFFKKLDKAWEASIVRVQERFGLNFRNEPLIPPAGLALGAKPNKAAPLITPPNFSMVDDITETQQPFANIVSDKIEAHEIKSFRMLLDNFSNLRLSSQAFTLLHSTTLQHIIAVTADRTVAVRLSFWLHHWLNKELVSTCGETKRGTELLKVVIEFSGFIQECLPVVEAFLFRYLFTWNGSDYRRYILSLVSKLNIISFQDLHTFVLMPLQKLCTFSSHVYFQCSVLNALSDLLSNYLTIERRRQEKLKNVMSDDESEPTRFSVYPQKTQVVDVNSVVTQLIQFVNLMFVENVRTVKSNLLFLHYMLQFHVQASSIYSRHSQLIVVLPPKQLIGEALFSLSAFCISSLCQILLNHRSVLSELSTKGKLDNSMQDTVDTLNQYLIDVYDTLWRRRAFIPDCSPNSVLYQNIKIEDFIQVLTHPQELPPHRMFAVDRHPALVIYSQDYLRILNKDKNEADLAEFVWEDSFMEYLQSRGLGDIVTFIETLRS